MKISTNYSVFTHVSERGFLFDFRNESVSFKIVLVPSPKMVKTWQCSNEKFAFSKNLRYTCEMTQKHPKYLRRSF